MLLRHATAMVLFVLYLPCYAQDAVKPLKIGEKVPDIVFNEVLNYSKEQVKLSDFRGKAVILDFWNTKCPTCINQFPRLKKIQDSLKNEVVILLIGFDLKEKGSIKEFALQRKKRKMDIPLPTVVQAPEEQLLLKLFPSNVMPHEVWIDKDGIFKGATGHEYVTAQNIINFNKGGIIWKKKKKLYIYPKDTFLVKRTVPFYYGSVITGYNDTLGGSGWNTLQNQWDSSMIRFFYTNHTVFHLYKDVYSIYNPAIRQAVFNKQIIVENEGDNFYKDAHGISRLDNWQREAFERKNMFCYELILPPAYTLQQAYKYMIQDLDKYFNIRSSLEKRKVTCLQLVRTSSRDKMATKQNKLVKEELETGVELACFSMNQILGFLNQHFTKLIVVDNTGYTGNVDLKLEHIQADNLLSFNKALAKYDLRLETITKEFEFLVLENLAKK